MSATLGLFDDYSDGAKAIIYRPDSVGNSFVSQRDLLLAALALSEQLPAGSDYMINLCKDRYQFMVGFCATLIAGKTNLLPSNRQLHSIEALQCRYTNSSLILDEVVPEFASLNTLDVRTVTPAVDVEEPQPPQIAAQHIAAIVFTSGSTGEPTAIEKTWQTFVGTAKLLARRFVADSDAAVSILATVPVQHMYGLETTIMLPLQSDTVIHCGQPFFPEDISRQLQQLPSPRVLVTTPVHLTALLGGNVTPPVIYKVISATAPLPIETAAVVEERFNCPLLEIFGCSEAGSLASRRTLSEQRWKLLDGVVMEKSSGDISVSGPQLADKVILQDQLEIIDDSHFHFLGRSADMLNVAGKRESLASLSQQLTQLEGVEDGLFFLPEVDGISRKRPAALVVSELSERDIIKALSLQVDPVFLPRPLRKVAMIPRNALGKVLRAELQRSLARGRE